MRTDLFHLVHKGIRQALFDAVTAVGRGDPAARIAWKNALRFTAHHGENEDVLLLPLLRARLPTIAARLQRQHHHVDALLSALQVDVDSAPLAQIYNRGCGFIGVYLAHIEEEEDVVDAAVRAEFDDAELVFFARESVARTAPDDARMMLSAMVPALTDDEAAPYLAKLPPALADELRDLRRAARGGS